GSSWAWGQATFRTPPPGTSRTHHDPPRAGAVGGGAEQTAAMRRTRILGAAVAMGLALLLAGCDQFLAEPMAYTRVDGTPVVRICIPLTITEVTVVRVDEER